MRTLALATGVFLAATPGAAQSLPRDRTEFSVGAASGRLLASVSRSIRFVSAGPLSGGVGLRVTGIREGNAEYHTARKSLLDQGISHQIQVDPATFVAINLGAYGNLRIAKNLELGASLDLIGATLGGKRQSHFIGGSAGQSGQGEVRPTSFNSFSYGDRDHGSLYSEFSLGYWFAKRVGVRAGLVHYVTEETLRTTPLTPTDDRFRRFSSVGFVGLNLKL